jgi:hypothetical protein
MKKAIIKTFNSFFSVSLPVIIGVLMLISLINPVFEKLYPVIFTGNYFTDPLIGTAFGTISFGIPVISYVTGGELLKQGVSLLAVTAFILSWSSVGTAMLPLEIMHLGKKFAIMRNSLNIAFSIIIAILTVLTLQLL